MIKEHPQVIPLLVPKATCGGRFVALRSFTDNTVVSSGLNAASVLRAARRKGADSPVIVFVPKREVTCLF